MCIGVETVDMISPASQSSEGPWASMVDARNALSNALACPGTTWHGEDASFEWEVGFVISLMAAMRLRSHRMITGEMITGKKYTIFGR